jgi:hypothetical protein
MANTPELDLNKFSTEDLIALKTGDLNKVSTEGLLMLKAAQPQQKTPKSGNIITSDVPTVVGERPNPVPIESTPTSMMDKVKALYEVPTAMASGMIAQPVGAAYGAFKGITGPKTPQAMQAAQQAGGELAQKLQYQPTSPASMGALESIGGAMESAKIPPYIGNIGMIPSAMKASGNVKPVMQESVMPVANRMAGALRNEAGMVKEAVQPAIAAASPVVSKMADTLRLKPSIIKTAPTSKELLEQSKAAFTTAKESGMQFNPEKFSTKMAEIGADLRKEGYTKPPPGETDPYAKITGALRNLTDVTNPKDFEELSTLRTIIRNGQKSGDSTERKFATILKDRFDDYVLNAPPEDVVGATKQGAEAWKTARDTWSRLSKSEIFEDMLNKADINASKVGTEKYLHNKLLELSNTEKKMRLFTPTEQEAIKEAAKGGKIQNILKLAGKYSPESVIATAAGSYAGAQMLGPAGAVIAPMVGGASKIAATQIRKNDVSKLAALMRAGTPKGVGNE